MGFVLWQSMSQIYMEYTYTFNTALNVAGECSVLKAQKMKKWYRNEEMIYAHSLKINLRRDYIKFSRRSACLTLSLFLGALHDFFRISGLS